MNETERRVLGEMLAASATRILAELETDNVDDGGNGNVCQHWTASGIDKSPLGPAKIWHCDHCGFCWTQGKWELVPELLEKIERLEETLRVWQGQAQGAIAALLTGFIGFSDGSHDLARDAINDANTYRDAELAKEG